MTEPSPLPEMRDDSERAFLLLQDLIRQPSVNRGSFEKSDGDERRCAELLADFFRDQGLDPEILESAPNRHNLVVRLKGTGEKPPLLLNAHTDVVEADENHWQHPPFGGEVHDGYLWGRGAIDMKHMAAMSAGVLGRLKAEGRKLQRDVIFTAVADEEAGCRRGSMFLVDEHADKVRAELMLGEVGGFSLELFGTTFYPIQVAEKGLVWLRAKYTGQPGHGSMPNPNSAVHKLARAIQRLGKKRLPTHPTEVVRSFLQGISEVMPLAQKLVMRKLSVPEVSGLILDHLMKDETQRRAFGAMLSNTASPTVARAGHKINVIPGEATIDIDGRTLPGQTTADFLREIRLVLDDDAEIEVLHEMPPVETGRDEFHVLSRALERHHPGCRPLPYLTPGFTDAKAYQKLGMRCYGFAPVRFAPEDSVAFTKLYHGHDERIPVEGFHWGFGVLYETVRELAGG